MAKNLNLANAVKTAESALHKMEALLQEFKNGTSLDGMDFDDTFQFRELDKALNKGSKALDKAIESLAALGCHLNTARNLIEFYKGGGR